MTLLVRSFLIVIMPVVLLSGCNDVTEYSGDGQLIDNGPGAATDRYVLKLGNIDLSQRGTKTYRIANLPETSFVTGIKITVEHEDRASVEKRAVNPTIRLELSDVSGEAVFKNESKLDTWTWSVPANEPLAFIYVREKQGTYFHPHPETEYTLVLTVLEPDASQTKYTASLLAKSGGWK